MFYKIMSDEPPAFKETKFVYIDKPVFATMISGGFFLALVLYFILDRALSQFPLSFLQFLPQIMFILIIIASILRGRQADVKIEINSLTGWVLAQNRTQEWEGYYFDAKSFQVLQRDFEVGNNIMTEYKLSLELHDSSKYEIPLTTAQARQLLELLEEMKKLDPKKSGKNNISK